MLAYHAGILSSWPFKRMRANGQQNPGREEASSESKRRDAGRASAVVKDRPHQGRDNVSVLEMH